MRFGTFRVDLTTRLVWTLFLESVLMVATVVLAMVDSSEWPGIFFQVTMLIVVLLNSEGKKYLNI